MSFMNHVYNPDKHKTFVPKFPDKYIGKSAPICRSEWEYKFMNWCDMNNSIVKWASEPLAIEYYDPVKQKNRRYYPDFLLRIKGKDGKETNMLVEIKPYKETIPPVKSKRKSEKTMIHEATTYMTNVAKWKAAISHCKKHSLGFKLLTEKDLFMKDN